jgi:hypothetical protein
MREEAEKEDTSEEAVRNKEFMEKYRQMRGPSLMESHAESRSKMPKAVKTERRPFDRELVSPSHIMHTRQHSFLLLLVQHRSV